MTSLGCDGPDRNIYNGNHIHRTGGNVHLRNRKDLEFHIQWSAPATAGDGNILWWMGAHHHGTGRDGLSV